MKILTHPFFAFLIGLSTGILMTSNIRYYAQYSIAGLVVWLGWYFLYKEYNQ